MGRASVCETHRFAGVIGFGAVRLYPSYGAQGASADTGNTEHQLGNVDAMPSWGSALPAPNMDSAIKAASWRQRSPVGQRN